MKYKMMFSPMNIGNVKIKNRVVMSPMMLGFGQINGNATEQMMNYYEERAKGGAGLIISEITRVDNLTGASSFGQLSASKDSNIESISELTNRLHKYDAKFFVQLHHPGRQNVSLMVNTVPISTFFDKIIPNNKYSELLYDKIVPLGQKLVNKNMFFKSVAPSKCPPSKLAESRVRALSRNEIKKIIKEFGNAALRVKQAGADGVELHAAHGYLIQQFLSPYTNMRNDEYGGNFQNRMRFLLEIISDIKGKCGNDFPIIVRLSVDEMYDRIGKNGTGYNLETGIKIAKELEQNGVDAIDVSSAGYDTFNYWLEPESFECGWRKNLAKAIKENVSIPVLAANLIRSPEQAEEQLEDGIQDFISLGRPHIADPYWANKVKNGRETEIKRCICCLHCFESMMSGAYKGDHAHCSVNPGLGYEGKKPEICSEQKNIVIIGAGVAGLTAAEILSKRNFNVTVIEKEEIAGGQINTADKSPDKDKIHWCIDDLVTNATKNGANIIYNTEASKEIIDKFNPYCLIFATGATPIVPQKFQLPNVTTATDILNGKVKPIGQKICLIGSGMTGLETAYLLTKSNNDIKVIEMEEEIAPNVWFQHLDDILPKLKSANVSFITGKKMTTVNKDYIELLDINNGKSYKEKCDLVVLSLGSKSNDALYERLKPFYNKCYKIGDCEATGTIYNATQSAYDLAMGLH